MNWPGNELLFTLLYALICLCSALLASIVLALPAAGRPLVQVIAGTLPIAVATLALQWHGGIEPAITLLSAAAATIAIFVNGAIILITPRPNNEPPPAQSPAASVVLPIAIVLLLAGFSTHLNAATSIGLAILGILCFDLVRSVPAPLPHTQSPAPPKFTWPLCIIVALLPLALLFLMTHQFWQAAQAPHILRLRDLALVNILCPALLLPLLRWSLRVAHDTSPADALSMSSGTIGLLLGLLMPAVFLADFLPRRLADDAALLGGLPQLSWRLDMPLLAVGGFALVALRLDILRPHRWVGLLLVLLYGAYLLTGSVLRLF